MDYSSVYLNEAKKIIDQLDTQIIESVVEHLAEIRSHGGRLFFIGVGGSAANCAHAVNDFRKIVGIESYAPTDNVAELTARTNDDGWETVFSEWLKISRLNSEDGLFVFSVGGGSIDRNISPNIVRAVKYAKDVGAKVLGVVGKDGGYTGQEGDAIVRVPVVNPDSITPHTEAFQGHLAFIGVSSEVKKVKPSGKVNPGGKFRPAIFLDRDGVLIASPLVENKPVAIRSLSDFQILPGVLEALEIFREIGYLLVCVTNQPDVARGTLPRLELDRITEALRGTLPLDAIMMCTHDDLDNCSCRKPKTGMIDKAVKLFDIDVRKSWVIGDRWRDIELGKRAGCKTILVDRSYSEVIESKPDWCVKNLTQAVEILRGKK